MSYNHVTHKQKQNQCIHATRCLAPLSPFEKAAVKGRAAMEMPVDGLGLTRQCLFGRNTQLFKGVPGRVLRPHQGIPGVFAR